MSPATDKLLAEWFWIDRWMGSSAFLLPMEARGVYREMLSQAWRRGARLPNDHEAIQRAIGATPKEWGRSWPLIERFWQTVDGYLINETQQDVYAEALARQETNSNRAQAGAKARWKQQPKPFSSNAQASTQAQPEQCPPSPSPSPDSVSDHRSPFRRERGSALMGAPSRNQIFVGRFSVPQQLHDQLLAAFGNQEDSDDRLRGWYRELNASIPEHEAIAATADIFRWLKMQFQLKFGQPSAVGSGLSSVTEAALRAVREAQ